MNNTPKSENKIKKARQLKGITQSDLGKMLGVSQSVIAQYETGIRNPKIDKLIQIANALQIDINSLLEDEKSPMQRAMERNNSPFLEDYTQHKLTENIKFENIDIELIKMFHQLNQKGKEKVIEYTSDLFNNADYKSTP